MDDSTVIEQGTGESADGRHTLRFVVRLPHSMEEVWTAVATPDGLVGWLAAADTLQPRLGGAVALRRLNGASPAVPGRITAWDVERVAEYTMEGFHGRIRFHLEPGTILRFTHEIEGDDSLRVDCLAAALDGRPTDWSSWTPERFQELRESYG